MATLQMYLGEVYLWKYIPSLALALVFVGLFIIATALHLRRMMKTKLWFCTSFVIGGFSEILGYIFRAAAYNATGSLVLYIMQSLFLLLPPILYAATLYMVYSRIVIAVRAETLSPLPLKWSTKIFVCCDVLFLNIQGNGGGLLAKSKTQHIGQIIVVVGLILQIISFILFILCCGIFHARFNRSLTSSNSNAGSTIRWRQVLHMLYGTSLLILGRNVYRVVEFLMDENGYLVTHEWPTYVFDGALMLLVMAAFYLWHPSLLQSGPIYGMIELADSVVGHNTSADEQINMLK